MFELTGSLHAAAIIAPGGSLQVVREDVGRHNAVDKVIGSAFLSEEYPLTDHVLVVSGRVSYEIVAKALRACMAGIVAVSGPTTLAVDSGPRPRTGAGGFHPGRPPECLCWGRSRRAMTQRTLSRMAG